MAWGVRKARSGPRAFSSTTARYTKGTLGVGLDLLGKLGVRLDSGAGRSGTGLLPLRDDGSAAGDYARLDATAKLRLSRSELKVGGLVPKLPTIQPNYGRLFPRCSRARC